MMCRNKIRNQREREQTICERIQFGARTCLDGVGKALRRVE